MSNNNSFEVFEILAENSFDDNDKITDKKTTSIAEKVIQSARNSIEPIEPALHSLIQQLQQQLQFEYHLFSQIICKERCQMPWLSLFCLQEMNLIQLTNILACMQDNHKELIIRAKEIATILFHRNDILTLLNESIDFILILSANDAHFDETDPLNRSILAAQELIIILCNYFPQQGVDVISSDSLDSANLLYSWLFTRIKRLNLPCAQRSLYAKFFQFLFRSNPAQLPPKCIELRLHKFTERTPISELVRQFSLVCNSQFLATPPNPLHFATCELFLRELYKKVKPLAAANYTSSSADPANKALYELEGLLYDTTSQLIAQAMQHHNESLLKFCLKVAQLLYQLNTHVHRKFFDYGHWFQANFRDYVLDSVQREALVGPDAEKENQRWHDSSASPLKSSIQSKISLYNSAEHSKFVLNVIHSTMSSDAAPFIKAHSASIAIFTTAKAAVHKYSIQARRRLARSHQEEMNNSSQKLQNLGQNSSASQQKPFDFTAAGRMTIDFTASETQAMAANRLFHFDAEGKILIVGESGLLNFPTDPKTLQNLIQFAATRKVPEQLRQERHTAGSNRSQW
jgi:hypothetical protein